jgi:hypothetical protein
LLNLTYIAMKKPPQLLFVNLLMILTATMLLVDGCSSVKRYKSASWKGEDNSLVNMELFGARLEQSSSENQERNLWDLSAGAQTQLIQILNERYPHNEQFMGALSKRYLGERFTGQVDMTRKDLKMVFTISKQRDYQLLNESSARFSPADRIEYLKFSLEIPPEYKLRFSSWNRYTTEYGEIEIADVSFSTSLDLELEGMVKGSDGSGKSTFNRNEQQEVKSRYLKLNGSMSEKRITVEEEGTREIDLTGNVMADVSLEFAGFPERIAIPHFSGNDADHAGVASLEGFSFADVMVPRMKEAPDTIMAHLTLNYVYRHVQAGGKTFAEWDDQVEYYSGEVKKKIPLFLKRDYLPGFYCIGSEKDPEKRLKVKGGGDQEYLLQFLNYEDASRVVEWLGGQKGALASDPVLAGNTSILLEGTILSHVQASQEKWKVIPVY